VTVSTDAEGRAKLRGFFGRYDVSVKANGVTRTLSVALDQESKGEVRVVLGGD